MKMKQTLFLKRRAFNLVEVMIAVFILGLAILPMWQVSQQSTRIVTVGQSESLAMDIGMGFAGQVQALRPCIVSDQSETPITCSDGGSLSIPGYSRKIQFPPWSEKIYKLTYSIKNMPGMGNAQLITLSIRWKNQIGGSRGATFPVIITGN